jgi:hypothetical protein
LWSNGVVVRYLVAPLLYYVAADAVSAAYIQNGKPCGHVAPRYAQQLHRSLAQVKLCASNMRLRAVCYRACLAVENIDAQLTFCALQFPRLSELPRDALEARGGCKPFVLLLTEAVAGEALLTRTAHA